MQEQELGRSKGGFSSKLHAASDALGNPIRFFITAGQRSDYVKALDLIEGQKMEALIADKGYDANYSQNSIKRSQQIIFKKLIDRRISRFSNMLKMSPFFLNWVEIG